MYDQLSNVATEILPLVQRLVEHLTGKTDGFQLWIFGDTLNRERCNDFSKLYIAIYKDTGTAEQYEQLKTHIYEVINPRQHDIYVMPVYKESDEMLFRWMLNGIKIF